LASKNITEGKIEKRIYVTGRHGRRHKQLLELKEEALDCNLWRTHFGRGMDLL